MPNAAASCPRYNAPPMTTAQNIHGHEILRLVHAARPALTRAALHEEARRRFGADARFCTCSMQGMTLAELVEFLTARGKLVEADGTLRAEVGQMCADGEH